ncbi:hypothetical protein FKM82_012427 [Ascaphus truei]
MKENNRTNAFHPVGTFSRCVHNLALIFNDRRLMTSDASTNLYRRLPLLNCFAMAHHTVYIPCMQQDFS